MKRVVLTGSECTGKTVLAEELARRFGCPWAPERSRDYAERKGSPLGPQDVGPIARAQVEAEHEAARRAAELLVLDTDLLSTLVYARHYYGACPTWVEQAAWERRGDLYLLLHPDVAWQADGVRDRGDRREEMHTLFEATLRELECRVVPVKGPWSLRRAVAQDAVQQLLAARA